MNEKTDGKIDSPAANQQGWMKPEEQQCLRQPLDLSSEQRKFQEFLTYLSNDANDKLPDTITSNFSNNRYERISIPVPKGIIAKSDCVYTYHQTEKRTKEVDEFITTSHEPPTLYEMIMRYFKLAIKI